jgi:hypothetical protein
VSGTQGDSLEQRVVVKATGYNLVYDSVTGRFVSKTAEHVETIYYCQQLSYVNASKDDVVVTVFTTKNWYVFVA